LRMVQSGSQVLNNIIGPFADKQIESQKWDSFCLKNKTYDTRAIRYP